MNIQEIKNNIDRFEIILKTALRQKYEGYPQAFLDNLQRTNFIYSVDLLSFVDAFELSGYPKERLREATEYCMDFKLQLYYLLEVDMGLYNKLIYPHGYDRSAPHKTPHLLLARQSLDQSLIVKSRILWERAMNLIYYLDTGKSIENKVSRNKSKRKVFSEFLSGSDKWKFMDQYMSLLSDFEEKYRSPESHKKSVLLAELMGNKVIDSNDLLDLVNYGTNVIWQGILTVLKGKTVMSRFYIEKKAHG
jgi:hypothetical protein